MNVVQSIDDLKALIARDTAKYKRDVSKIFSAAINSRNLEVVQYIWESSKPKSIYHLRFMSQAVESGSIEIYEYLASQPEIEKIVNKNLLVGWYQMSLYRKNYDLCESIMSERLSGVDIFQELKFTTVLQKKQVSLAKKIIDLSDNSVTNVANGFEYACLYGEKEIIWHYISNTDIAVDSSYGVEILVEEEKYDIITYLVIEKNLDVNIFRKHLKGAEPHIEASVEKILKLREERDKISELVLSSRKGTTHKI